MEVYIESVICENFAIDFLLLWLALVATKEKVFFSRLFLASSVGVAIAVLFPFFPDNALKTPCKILFGGLAVRIATKGKTKKFLFVCGAFYLATFALGGLMYFFDGRGKLSAFKRACVVACFLPFAVALKSRFYARKAIKKFVYPCELVNGTVKVKTNGFFDSGNRLTLGGMPVCFVSDSLFFRLSADEKNAESVLVRTVNGEREVNVYTIEKLVIYSDGKPNTIEKAKISPSDLKTDAYGILLGAGVFGSE